MAGTDPRTLFGARTGAAGSGSWDRGGMGTHGNPVTCMNRLSQKRAILRLINDRNLPVNKNLLAPLERKIGEGDPDGKGNRAAKTLLGKHLCFFAINTKCGNFGGTGRVLAEDERGMEGIHSEGGPLEMLREADLAPTGIFDERHEKPFQWNKKKFYRSRKTWVLLGNESIRGGHVGSRHVMMSGTCL